MVTAVKKAPKPRELCPRCYNEGVENDLIYNQSSRTGHSCSRGHVWEDQDEVTAREILGAEMMEMNKKRRALEPPKPATPAPDPSVIVDARIKIDDIDRERIESFLGHFGDSSTLFGLIFAKNEEMKDLQEKLTRAESRVATQGMRQIAGEHAITVIIPERHFETLKDVAEAGGMTIERFMNSRIEDGLDNCWYY